MEDILKLIATWLFKYFFLSSFFVSLFVCFVIVVQSFWILECFVYTERKELTSMLHGPTTDIEEYVT